MASGLYISGWRTFAANERRNAVTDRFMHIRTAEAGRYCIIEFIVTHIPTAMHPVDRCIPCSITSYFLVVDPAKQAFDTLPPQAGRLHMGGPNRQAVSGSQRKNADEITNRRRRERTTIFQLLQSPYVRTGLLSSPDCLLSSSVALCHALTSPRVDLPLLGTAPPCPVRLTASLGPYKPP